MTDTIGSIHSGSGKITKDVAVTVAREASGWIAGSDPDNVHVQTYSGRGMSGRQCLGVVVPRSRERSFLIALGSVAVAIDDCNLLINGADGWIGNQLYQVGSDDMGSDSVVLYWPGVRLVED